jgi:hypothetical protein
LVLGHSCFLLYFSLFRDTHSFSNLGESSNSTVKMWLHGQPVCQM